MWELMWMRKGSKKGTCPPSRKEKDAVYILLKCPATRTLREQILSKIKLRLNEEIVCKKITKIYQSFTIK
jgi:hypothetical protein